MKRLIITSNKAVNNQNGSHIKTVDLNGKDESENYGIFLGNIDDLLTTEDDGLFWGAILEEEESYKDILKRAKREGLIEDYKIKEVEDN